MVIGYQNGSCFEKQMNIRPKIKGLIHTVGVDLIAIATGKQTVDITTMSALIKESKVIKRLDNRDYETPVVHINESSFAESIESIVSDTRSR